VGLLEVDGINLVDAGSEVLPSTASESLRDSDLSSGQWNWLSSLVGLALEIDDHSLVLVDEPENSLHPEWQRAYLRKLGEIVADHASCHTIVATHSALIAGGLPASGGDVRAIRSEAENGSRRATVELVSSGFGWTSEDVYSEVFDVTSTRAPDFVERANKALGMIREGVDARSDEFTAIVSQLKVDGQGLPIHDSMRDVIDAIVDHVLTSDAVGEE
jgi:hypothetical protein